MLCRATSTSIRHVATDFRHPLADCFGLLSGSESVRHVCLLRSRLTMVAIVMQAIALPLSTQEKERAGSDAETERDSQRLGWLGPDRLGNLC